MKRLIPMSQDPRASEFGRFVINGVFAAGIHFAALTFNLRVLELSSAGLANFFAAWLGITASFMGSRLFVFRGREAPMASQALRFLLLYGAVACLHGLLLYVWTDRMHQGYIIGFALAAVMQTVLSYLGNKFLVFKTA